MEKRYPNTERELTSEELALLKNKELLIMDEIHRICVKHKIQYSLFYGSMLGAVRHHGFIPWDDDMDIVMLRQEYVRFEEICKTELRAPFFLQTHETDPYFQQPFLKKIRLNGTELVEYATRKSSMHQGIWVDIFVLDYADDSLFYYEKERKTMRLWKDKYRFSYSFGKSNLKGKAFLLFRLLQWPFAQRCTALKAERYRLKSITCSTLHRYVFDANTISKRELYSLRWFTDAHLCNFENRKYYCLDAYEECLKVVYGDYLSLPPMDQRRPNHGYCFVNLGDKL